MAKTVHARRTLSYLLSFTLIVPVLTTATDIDSGAKEILTRYLAIPHPKGPSKTDAYDPKTDKEVNEARQTRLAILAELKAMPADAVSVAEQAIFVSASPEQRYEIVGFLAEIHTDQCAKLLYRVLQDVRNPENEDESLYEELVRSSAVHGLRMMARRADRSGGKRILNGSEFDPAVPGLVPYLIFAASDKAKRVRVNALYALADSRDPLAVTELKHRLKDNSEKVRLYAACFLTEYQDAAGLPEILKSLSRLRETDSRSPEHNFDYYMQMEMVLASLERITGKSFGEIPLNPLLVSSPHEEAQRYKELLDTWHAWWIWQPDY